MVMDLGLCDLSVIVSQFGVKLDECNADGCNGLGFDLGSFTDQNPVDASSLTLVSVPKDDPISSLSFDHGGDSAEDNEIFSDIALRYIDQMLMEEDMEDTLYMYQESSALQAAEKSLYEAIGENYPPSPEQGCFLADHNLATLEDNAYGNPADANDCCWGANRQIESVLTFDAEERWASQCDLTIATDQATSMSSSSSSNSVTNVLDALDEPSMHTGTVSEFIYGSLSFCQFRQGINGASKFLPHGNKLHIDLESNRFHPQQLKEESPTLYLEGEKKGLGYYSACGLRGRKTLHPEEVELEEERSNKQYAVCSHESGRTEIFDMVLLGNEGKSEPAISTLKQWSKEIGPPSGGSYNVQKGQTKGSNATKSRGKKQGKREVVDLWTLLMTCAQAVAGDDCRTGTELLKQIRQHSSPFGDGSQRLAHIFADGLEARLAGSGSQIYRALSMKRTTAADVLKAYHLYLSACPFKKLAHLFANQTIIDAVENKSRLHIVDFGIYFGFQWPCLMQRLANRPGGPPKLRITGIDLPQPGFRPAERVEETGKRLTDYAKDFNIPFEFTPLACKWEIIQVENIQLEEDEVLVVNCIFRFKNLADESVMVECPRNIVLNTIRKMNPDVFVHGIINGAFGAPFFITRFREALFHYSALFDMLETNVAREHPQRMLLEKEIFGREALNIIACEGSERIERPETYKQWQVRNTRAGFTQLPLSQNILKKAKDKVRLNYHKDFVIDEDGHWMLQGWKGRTMFAVSAWRPDGTKL